MLWAWMTNGIVMDMGIDVDRIFSRRVHQARGPAVQGHQGGGIVSKMSPSAIYLGPSLLQGAPAETIGLGWGP